ncbi:unnamed protein product [Vitrella brassicaformis CCMP3155]|uniref:Obg family GTPase CgtA n=2 Tax=Vitrella brassicaformis TaxID=1169539 RepID=A0A0G4H7G0_VITBC|nr:unnamed protein product [Vitrella brassicaformis CCMP3155]|eukprot:CEM39830.1 unnamed protein product [Vitrella brassicaformis CCMP3155]
MSASQPCGRHQSTAASASGQGDAPVQASSLKQTDSDASEVEEEHGSGTAVSSWLAYLRNVPSSDEAPPQQQQQQYQEAGDDRPAEKPDHLPPPFMSVHASRATASSDIHGESTEAAAYGRGATMGLDELSDAIRFYGGEGASAGRSGPIDVCPSDAHGEEGQERPSTVREGSFGGGHQVAEDDPTSKARSVMTSLTEEDTESFPRYQRPFVDLMWVECKAGNGGSPLPLAKRKPIRPHGPGYGGHGGNVILRSTHLVQDFLRIDQKIRANDGEDAHDTHRGKHAKHLTVYVPQGTIIRKRIPVGEKRDGRKLHRRVFWYQILNDNEELTVATGGLGGLGFSSFKKKDGRRAAPGEKVLLELELRIMTDACLLGMPNSGKTSLMAAMTRSHTRIGPEPFSTTRPHVSVIGFRDDVRIRVADLPGLYEGAHVDKLKGCRILRHTYRSKLLIYVVDVANRDSEPDRDPLKEVEVLMDEAKSFFEVNKAKKELVIATKCDMLHKDALFNLDSLYFRLKARYPDIDVIGTSARFGLGIERAVTRIRQLLYPDMLLTAERVKAKPIDEILLPNEQMKQESLTGIDRLQLPGFIIPPAHGADTKPPPSRFVRHPRYNEMELMNIEHNVVSGIAKRYRYKLIRREAGDAQGERERERQTDPGLLVSGERVILPADRDPTKAGGRLVSVEGAGE